jgi:Carbohydrate family 9 binding domain-like/Secretion system C-terminal sorting domain
MKQFTIFLLFLIWSTLSVGQTTIENFDLADSTLEENVEGAPSYINFTSEPTDFVEGTGALRVKYSIGAFHPWGSFGNALYRLEDGEELMDWTINDSLSIWIKVTEAPTHPEYMVFRLHLVDRPAEDDAIEEYIYENIVLFNEVTEWMELKIPLIERETDGGTVPNDEGFVLMPLGWGGTQNNSKLDRDKILGYNLSAVTTGWTDPDNIPADSVEVLYDNFTRFGTRALPYIFFNGIALPSTFTANPWGQSGYSVEEGAGATEGTNAIKWVQGDEWGGGWSGVVFETSNPFNLMGSLIVDSLKFKMKAEAGTGAIRMQFESGDDGKIGSVFSPIDDGEWHEYSLALSDMTPQDETTNFNAASVIKIGFMAEGNAVVGKVIYLDDWWTGNPVFDVIAPNAPALVAAAGGDFVNVVTWIDVPGESSEVYDVYYSTLPITDVTAEGVEVVQLGALENLESVNHVLRAPVVDQEVTYYYAVVCKDAAGNSSDVTVADAPTTNTAKGVTVIMPTAPVGFAADGNLSEWAGFTPFRMFPDDGSGSVVTNQVVDNDADLSVNAYVAMDAEYLYIAFDVEDDIIVNDTTIDSYKRDGCDIFIGLYDWRGPTHTGFKRGAEPDYQFRFLAGSIISENPKDFELTTADDNYAYFEKFPSGYIMEGRIALADIAAIADPDDDLFTPVVGKRIKIDFSINDADATGEREGIMTYSPVNEDKSWQQVNLWTYTWIGDQFVDVDDETAIPLSYELSQNYPNPFNPSTVIKYSVVDKGNISLKVYNLLGQEIATLINKVQAPGVYQVNFDASELATGMYIYQLQAGSFVTTKKMLLVK